MKVLAIILMGMCNLNSFRKRLKRKHIRASVAGDDTEYFMTLFCKC